ncbi:hypothetical protein K2Q00_00335 [Patescibacteria group bacterium]|nr:hypothetical protein [Patescibacteria group bacterium]
MLNRIVSAVLATAFLFAATSAQAQFYGSAPSPQHYRCTPDGKPATPGTGWCKRNDAPTSTVSAPSVSNLVPVAGTAPGAVVLNQGDLDELRRQYELDKAAQRPTVPAPQVAAQAPAVQVPAQPFRVFTPGVSIEALAGAFKEGSESNVLNAPIGEVEAAIARFSGVDVSPELLVKGALVDCQKAGVEGKHRVGVKSKQKMNGLKEFNFATIGSELKDCQSGQKLYIVRDRDGKNVAIADSSGYLLGKAPTVAEIKVDR